MRVLLAAVLALLIAACDTAGPPGPPGELGPTGPVGPAGNASVLVASSEFGPSSCALDAGRIVCPRDWPHLTQARVTAGAAFLLYVRATGSPEWVATPYVTFDGTRPISVTSTHQVGRFTLRIASEVPLANTSSGTMRAVLIPQGSNRMAAPPAYADLAAAYGLPMD